jgi:hypothetical protein
MNDQRIVVSFLPDGSDHEVLVSSEEARVLRRPPGTANDGVACATCGSDLIHPVSWEQTGERTWLVSVCCPECDAEYDEAMPGWRVEQFVAQLHTQKRSLARELARLELADFACASQRFVTALHAGQVLPEDF